MGLFRKKKTFSPDEIEGQADFMKVATAEGFSLTESVSAHERKRTTAKEEQHPVKRFALPEWLPQSGTIIAWPHANTDWAYMLNDIERVYLRLSFEIARRQPLVIISPEPEKLRKLLAEQLPSVVVSNMMLFNANTDDTWTRDMMPITVENGDDMLFLDFKFNGWGEKFKHSYDNALSRQLYEQGLFKGRYESHLDFVLEGGSIDIDGRGTLMTTTQCLLAPNRNQPLSKQDIEDRLKRWLGTDRVLWLEHGFLFGDDTDGHIDMLCRFCPGGKIAYVKADNGDDLQNRELRLMEEQLRTFVQPDGCPYELVGLPSVAPVFSDTSNGAAEQERLPASYANFLLINGAVLLPVYGQPERDEQAAKILGQLFPNRQVVGIDARPLIRQHGSVHCSAMQFPRGAINVDNIRNRKN